MSWLAAAFEDDNAFMGEAAPAPHVVGDYGLGERVLGLREAARHLWKDLGVMPAQVIYNAADQLAHDVLDAFPDSAGPALLAYQSKVAGFMARADAINEVFKQQTGVDIYALPWKPVLPTGVDDMLTGHNLAAAGDQVKAAAKAAGEAIANVASGVGVFLAAGAAVVLLMVLAVGRS